MFTPHIFSALLFLAALCSAGVASAQIRADSASSFDSTGLRGKIETELEYPASTAPSRDIPLHRKTAKHLRNTLFSGNLRYC